MYTFDLVFNGGLALTSAVLLMLIETVRHDRDVMFLIIQNFVLMPTLVVNCFFYHSVWLILVLGFLGLLGATLSWVVEGVFFKRLGSVLPSEGGLNTTLIATYTLICLVINPYVFTSINPLGSYLDAYDVRADLQFNGALGYFLNSCVFLIIPVAINSILKRKIFSYIASATVMLAIYTLMPITSYILLFVLISVVSFAYYILRIGMYWVVNGFLMGVLLVATLDFTLMNMIINRFFYIIGVTNIFYYDYFSVNPLFLFEGSSLEFFFGGSGYSVPPGIVIDNIYYEGLGTNQSAGFLGSAYANGGELFVLFSYFLVTAYAVLVSIVNQSYQAKLIHVLLGFSLINFPAHQIVLTNGFLIYLLLRVISSERYPHHRLLPSKC